jgi:hypothetical protein
MRLHRNPRFSYNNSEMFVDSDFVIKLAHLCGIFEKLNSLNTSLQGRETHILQLYDKIVSFSGVGAKGAIASPMGRVYMYNVS